MRGVRGIPMQLFPQEASHRVSITKMPTFRPPVPSSTASMWLHHKLCCLSCCPPEVYMPGEAMQTSVYKVIGDKAPEIENKNTEVEPQNQRPSFQKALTSFTWQ